jgi:hypothetical protein
MKRVFLALAVLTVIGITIWWLLPDSKQRKGEDAVRQIEEFRQSHHRLPSSLSEIGIEDSEADPIYYNRVDDRNYCVWYGTTLGESVTYESTKRAWIDTNSCIVSRPSDTPR